MNRNLEILAQDEMDPKTARDIISSALGSESGYVAVYNALCRWTWRVTIECRLDDELRLWHRFLLDTSAKIAAQSKSLCETNNPVYLDPVGVSERIRALADIVRMSVDAAVATDLGDFTDRAHIFGVLQLLASATASASSLDKNQIKDELGLQNANLSRVLTLLVANGLVERTPRDSNASFCISDRGLSVFKSSEHCQ